MEKGSDRRLSLKNDHSPAGEIRSRIVMLEFKPITAADGVWARPLLLKADCISCGYTFANLFVWSTVYHTDLARFQDFVIARCFDHPNTPDSPYLYLFPEGDGDKRAAILEIVQDAAVHGKMPPAVLSFPAGQSVAGGAVSRHLCLYLLPRYFRLHLQQRGAAKPARKKISKEEEPHFPFPAGASGLCI